MFESFRKLIDIIFKSMGILFIVVVFVFIVVIVKSCSVAVNQMDTITKPHLENNSTSSK